MNDTTIEYYRKLSNDLQRKVSDLRAENEMLMVSIKRAEWLHDVAKASNGILQQEVEHIRAELARIKPSWDDAPENAEYLAQDEDWSWEFHLSEPRPYETEESLEDSGWWGSTGWCDSVRNKNWRNTLEPRPKDDR